MGWNGMTLECFASIAVEIWPGVTNGDRYFGGPLQIEGRKRQSNGASANEGDARWLIGWRFHVVSGRKVAQRSDALNIRV